MIAAPVVNRWQPVRPKRTDSTIELNANCNMTIGL